MLAVELAKRCSVTLAHKHRQGLRIQWLGATRDGQAIVAYTQAYHAHAKVLRYSIDMRMPRYSDTSHRSLYASIHVSLMRMPRYSDTAFGIQMNAEAGVADTPCLMMNDMPRRICGSPIM